MGLLNMGGVVGKDTGRRTQEDRKVYETSEGELVSEQSTTFKYKGRYVNVPSIHNGYSYDDNTLKLMLDEDFIKPTSIHDTLEEAIEAAKKHSDNLDFNKGGTLMMNSPDQEFAKGGLKDEGGEIDSVSGNEVPVGGTKKGVRDDIDVNMSEGEFVFPEDVTRYHGLEKLMNLRQEAKAGLQRMNQMGMMGNSDEATLPDDMPFSLSDLMVVSIGEDGEEKELNDEELNMAVGGLTTLDGSATTTRTDSGVTRTGNSTDDRFVDPRDRMVSDEPQVTNNKKSSTVDYNIEEVLGEASLTFVEYRNDSDESMTIPHIGGNPVHDIPEGYTKYNPNATQEKAINEGDDLTAARMSQEFRTGDDRVGTTGNAAIDDPSSVEPRVAMEDLNDADYVNRAKQNTGVGRYIAQAIAFAINPIAGMVTKGLMRRNDAKTLAGLKARYAKVTDPVLKEQYEAQIVEYENEEVGNFSSVVDNVLDKVAGAFGFEKNIINTAKKANAVSSTVPVNDIIDDKNIVKPKSTAVAAIDKAVVSPYTESLRVAVSGDVQSQVPTSLRPQARPLATDPYAPIPREEIFNPAVVNKIKTVDKVFDKKYDPQFAQLQNIYSVPDSPVTPETRGAIRNPGVEDTDVSRTSPQLNAPMPNILSDVKDTGMDEATAQAAVANAGTGSFSLDRPTSFDPKDDRYVDPIASYTTGTASIDPFKSIADQRIPPAGITYAEQPTEQQVVDTASETAKVQSLLSEEKTPEVTYDPFGDVVSTSTIPDKAAESLRKAVTANYGPPSVSATKAKTTATEESNLISPATPETTGTVTPETTGTVTPERTGTVTSERTGRITPETVTPVEERTTRNTRGGVASTGRSESEIQRDINSELADGTWTDRASALVRERDSARANQGGQAEAATSKSTYDDAGKSGSKGNANAGSTNAGGYDSSGKSGREGTYRKGGLATKPKAKTKNKKKLGKTNPKRRGLATR